MSRRLARLEDTHGERLLQRSTRYLTVTEFGERMLEHVRRLYEESEAANALALNRRAEPQGTLRVSLPPEFRQLPVAEIVTRFARRYPHVRLQLDVSARLVDLLAERFDVAVRAAVRLPDDGTLVARRVSIQQSGLYASPDYLAEHGTPDRPAALLDHAGLVLHVRGEPQPWRFIVRRRALAGPATAHVGSQLAWSAAGSGRARAGCCRVIAQFRAYGH